MAIAGGLLFVAVVAAGTRVEAPRALPLLALGTVALAVSVIVYDGSALGFSLTPSASPPRTR